MKVDEKMRFDYTKNLWVVSAGKRSKRPHVKKKSECPFCKGSEHLTPPTTFALPSEKEWSVRCFENAFPIISGKYGRHEVVVESGKHDELFQALSLGQLARVFEAYKNRFNALSGKCENVFLFKNHGDKAGASIPHEHAQILGTHFVPDLLEKEFAAFKKSRKCFYCGLLKGEVRKNKLVENDVAVAFLPSFARFPYETWVLSKKHVKDFNGLSVEEGSLFLELLQEVVKKLEPIAVDYIIAFHQATGGVKDFHLHAEVYPRKSIWAGAELGAGLMINSRTEKQALEELRGSG